MALWAILKITDGTTSVDLLSAGFRLLEWLPAISEGKGGGVWKDSPLSEGRQLTFRRFGNVIETLKLAISDGSQEAVITSSQNLRRLLEQAISYWMDKSGTVDPVWIEARGECETYSRYALIYDYRTPNDGDPYGTAFSPRSAPYAFDSWQLLIERGHWLADSPGSNPTCLQLSNTQSNYTYGANLVLNYSFETAGGGGADKFADWAENAGDGTAAQDVVDVYHLSWCAHIASGPSSDTYIQQDIAVAAGATYVLSFAHNCSVAGGPGIGYPGRYRIIDNTHAVDITALTLLPYCETTDWYNFAVSFTTPAGCISVGIVLMCPTSNGKIAHFDYVVLSRMTAATFGRSATCTNEVYITNHSSKGQITHICTYNASIATYSANLMTSALPLDLFPNPIGVGDMVHFTIDDGALYNGPFCNLIFDLAQAGGGTLAGVWEYWNGGWVALSTVDGTVSLTATGVCGVAFAQPTDWVKAPLSPSVPTNGYWMRFRVTGLGAGVPRPQQQNRMVYTANQAQVNITGTDILGDIPSLAKFNIYGLGDSAGSMKDLMLYTRSLDKGSRFNPFINLSDITQETEITINLSGTNYVNAPDAPTGRAVWFHPAAAGTGEVSVYIANPLCNDYFGDFRLFLRVKQTGGSAGEGEDWEYAIPGGPPARSSCNCIAGNCRVTSFKASSTPINPISQGVGEPGVIHAGSLSDCSRRRSSSSQLATSCNTPISHLKAFTRVSPIHFEVVCTSGLNIFARKSPRVFRIGITLSWIKPQTDCSAGYNTFCHTPAAMVAAICSTSTMI